MARRRRPATCRDVRQGVGAGRLRRSSRRLSLARSMVGWISEVSRFRRQRSPAGASTTGCSSRRPQGTCNSGRSLESLDLSDATLDGLRFFGVKVRDCCFDRVRAHDWRMWASEFRESGSRRPIFAGRCSAPGMRAKLACSTTSASGPPICEAQFSSTPDYVDCDFSRRSPGQDRLPIERFRALQVRRRLQEIIFWDHGFKKGKPEPNPMEDVDFSGAELRGVEFGACLWTESRFPRRRPLRPQSLPVRSRCRAHHAERRHRRTRARNSKPCWSTDANGSGLVNRSGCSTATTSAPTTSRTSRSTFWTAARECASQSPPASAIDGRADAVAFA